MRKMKKSLPLQAGDVAQWTPHFSSVYEKLGFHTAPKRLPSPQSSLSSSVFHVCTAFYGSSTPFSPTEDAADAGGERVKDNVVIVTKLHLFH